MERTNPASCILAAHVAEPAVLRTGAKGKGIAMDSFYTHTKIIYGGMIQ